MFWRKGEKWLIHCLHPCLRRCCHLITEACLQLCSLHFYFLISLRFYNSISSFLSPNVLNCGTTTIPVFIVSTLPFKYSILKPCLHLPQHHPKTPAGCLHLHVQPPPIPHPPQKSNLPPFTCQHVLTGFDWLFSTDLDLRLLPHSAFTAWAPSNHFVQSLALTQHP